MMLRKRKDSDNIIVGLDAGTTKICIIVAEKKRDGLDILHAKLYRSNGIRKGIVVSAEETANSIKNAIADTEKQTGIKIREVYTSITGSHIKNTYAYGVSSIGAKRVSPKDVEMAVNSTAELYMPLEREILHMLPVDFIVDGQSGIIDPVGLSGSRLEAKVNIITCDALLLQSLIRCCEMADLKVVEVFFQPIASAESVLTIDEMDEGAAIIDIGGGTTDIAIYKDGCLKHASVFAIGGVHFTNDIAVGAQMTFSEAEAFKKKYGLIVPPSIDASCQNGYDTVRQKKGISKINIAEIIRLRAEELLNLINQELQIAQKQNGNLSGVVMTGGASLLLGFDRMAEEILFLPVRIGYADANLKNMGSGHNKSYKLKVELNNPAYAACLGLVLSGTDFIRQTGQKQAFFNTFLNKTTGWLKDILSRN